MLKLGQLAILIAMAGETQRAQLIDKAKIQNCKVCTGKVGSMRAEKVISSILTAAKREELWVHTFREEHALYDAIIEALSGICRGQLALGDILRTVGLNFAVVRGTLDDSKDQWFAVCLYGTIGAPIKGFEHETIGLGINHV